MRLWFLIRSLEPGGAERQLVTLARGLKERQRWEGGVIVFYSGGILEEELRKAGIPVWSAEKRGRWDVLRFLWRLARLVRRARPHILHSYLPMSNLLTLGLKALVPGMRVAWGVRASYVDLSRYDWLARLEYRLSRSFARWADIIVVNSWVGREHHRSLGYPAEKMVVIPNGIDTERFRPDPEGRERVRREWGVDKGEKLIGLVGRLDPMKDHPTFLRAAALLSHRRKEARFVCVGGGPEVYRREMESLAGSLGLSDRLVWAGVHRDMPAVYSALDVLSSSSFGEGFPNVVAEAMACGVPCVVTDVGDAARIVGETGLVVPPGDPAALAEGWERILALSPEEYGRLQHAARERVVREFSVEALVDRTWAALGGGQPERLLPGREVPAE